jgi:hypothetical protein
VIALEAVHLEDLVVVDDDPVVNPDHLALANWVIVGLDRRMPLGVVAHMDQNLRCVLRNRQLPEQRAGARTALVHNCGPAGRAVGVADGVGTALRDAGKQRLGSECSCDSRTRLEAISSDSAHGLILGTTPDGLTCP